MQEVIIVIRYYCSGFDINNAFGHGLGDMFKFELANTKSIVYVPGGENKIQKVREKYVPIFTEHFKNAGIIFEQVNIISPELSKEQAKEMISNASFIVLMGGNPFKQKELCDSLDILEDIKKFNGILLGYSAGAMLMSKYIIITPCSEEYPDFHIENGLNFDGISIYPHNNTSEKEYPNTLVVDDETYQKADLIKVANEYGDYYLLQDYARADGLTDISIIKSTNGKLDFYTENDGKIWLVESSGITLENKNKRIQFQSGVIQL